MRSATSVSPASLSFILLASVIALILPLSSCATQGLARETAPPPAIPAETVPERPRGPWLGQSTPIDGSAVFGPGFVSLPGSNEYGCCFSRDMQEFYFTRQGSRSQDILVTQVVGGAWSTPEVIVSSAHEPCLTPDGKTLYFGWFHALPPGEANVFGEAYGIWALDRGADGWGEPRYVGQGMYVSAAADGSLYVTEFSPGRQGRLARVTLADGRFAAFERLGGGIAELESAYDTIAHPAIAPDQSWILFDVAGGEHLFLSFRLSDGSWGPAIDLAQRGFDPSAGIASISPDGEFIFWLEGGELRWAPSSIIEALRPPTGERLYFHAYPTRIAAIFSSTPGGADRRQLTDGKAEDSCPIASPDGRSVAFISDRDGNFEIYLMDSDGLSPRRLTDSAANEGPPRWSPDGRRIVTWEMGPTGGDGAILLIDRDSGNREVVAALPEGGSSPDISPDGTRIVFSTARSGRTELWVMDADGTGQRSLARREGDLYMARWSPDGKRILYTELLNARTSRTRIHVMNADGTGDVSLPALGEVNEDASWSPDGSRIVFQTDRDGNYELYSSAPDGAFPHRLTRTSYMENYPDWARAPR